MSEAADVLRDALARVLDRQELAPDMMADAMRAILGGDGDPLQLAALAIALRMRGETSGEIAAAARVLRERAEAVRVRAEGPVLDTCGTGGDGLGTFNISTVTAIVVAACGVTVAKHGNRAVSSKAGSADVLEALGVRIDLPAARVREVVDEVGIGFLFAPAHHHAMRHAAPVRRALGVRTFFNLLGPLANPARATHQVLGVYDRTRVHTMAEVLGQLGVTAAWVVHGQDGLDEIAPHGATRVAKLAPDGTVTEAELRPSNFGLAPVPLKALVGGDAEENAGIARAILGGEAGPRRNAILMNAAAALVVCETCADLPAGVARAAEAIDSGHAAAKLKTWAEATRA